MCRLNVWRQHYCRGQLFGHFEFVLGEVVPQRLLRRLALGPKGIELAEAGASERTSPSPPRQPTARAVRTPSRPAGTNKQSDQRKEEQQHERTAPKA
jgi:hypothetical protein